MFTLPSLLAGGLVARILKDAATGLDGETYDVGRLLAILGGTAYIGMGIYGVVHATPDHPFAYQEFGIGFGSMAAGVGALLKLKEGSEPKPPAA